MFNRAKKIPLKLIVSKGIQAIRSSGRTDLEDYARRLENANASNDVAEATKVMAELAAYLDGHRKKVAGTWT